MAAPLAIPLAVKLAGAASMTGSAFRGLTGLRQMRDARRALQGLEEPEMYVPSAIRQRAQEPIAVEFMSAQEDAAARRTGQSVGALQKAGARGIIGGVNQVMDSERGQERARVAGYEQERRGALSELGRAQENLQGRQMQNYLSKMQGALRSLEAGQQNVSGALGDVSSLGQSVVGGYLQGGDFDKKKGGGITIGETRSTKSKNDRPKLPLDGLEDIGQEIEEGVLSQEQIKDILKLIGTSNLGNLGG